MSIIYPELRPGISNIRAVITTAWDKRAYRPKAIRRIESYYVDTSLDNDADTWTLDVGDPTGELIDMFARDSEVRVQIFGPGTQQVNYLVTGIADEISYDEEGTITLTGRDLSSLAIDSTVPPQKFGMVRSWNLIGKQAKEIGFKQTNLAQSGIIKKIQRTNGSESYWELWYRLCRKDKMWLWCEPDGTLTANRLNYEGSPSYYFGEPRDEDTQYVKRIYIPIEHAEYRKSTQQRVGEVWVYGHHGDNGFLSVARDPTMRNWIKKPRRVLLDTESHTTKGAMKTGWNEIFEGKVGSRELQITIPDPGFMIRQNRVARVRIPGMSIYGDYFIVGIRAQGGANGFLQEIRLREKQYALTRRIPAEPKIIGSPGLASGKVIASAGDEIAGIASMPSGWGDYFVKAAQKFHGPWDFNLFLATLVSICDQETGFRNIRQNGGIGGNGHIWEPPPSGVEAAPRSVVIVPGTSLTPGLRSPDTPAGTNPLEIWKQRFANEKGDGYVNMEYGVGPMQLTDRGLKHEADDLLKPGYRNEFAGGRWHPEHNIWTAAKYLRSCLQGTVRDSGRDIDIWMGAMAYNRGVQGALDYFAANGHPSPYAIQVKQKVMNDPGYLASVKSALASAREAAKLKRDGQTDFGRAETDNTDVGSLPNEQQAAAFFSLYNTMYNPLASAGPDKKRQAIVNAAMYGYYNADAIHYSMGSKRMKDFGPPPNVPDYTDCSGYVTWCYKSAKASDPNGLNYNGQGYTGTLWNNGKQISYAQIKPGDLVFYGNPNSTHSHVVVYVGFGKVVSFGEETGPHLYTVNYRKSELHGFCTYTV